MKQDQHKHEKEPKPKVPPVPPEDGEMSPMDDTGNGNPPPDKPPK